MREWLIIATNASVVVINWLALIVVVVGAADGFVRGVWTMVASGDGHMSSDAWLRLGRWLVAGLTFQLAADIDRERNHHELGEGWAVGGGRSDPHGPQLFSRARSERVPTASGSEQRVGCCCRLAPAPCAFFQRRRP